MSASAPSAPIRQAATLVLLRDSAAGPEVFMLQRTKSAVFLGGAYVFPGGALDGADADPRLHARCAGLDDARASARLGISSNGLAYWIAAIRETFEEAGILLARPPEGGMLPHQAVEQLLLARPAICRGECSFAAALLDTTWMLACDELVYFDHWITPPLRTRRFDTRFFLAAAPPSQQGSHDDGETVHSLWVTPREALAREERKEIDVAFATHVILQGLARYSSVAAALAAARALGPIEVNRPAIAQGRDGPRIVRRGDPSYHEIRWCDPDETTTSTYDLSPSEPKRLDTWVTRIIAPNPGFMTGPGTNTYLLGRDEMAVIDPGPAIDSHVDAILRETGARLRWILCTHTHRDHSPAAATLKARTGAEVIGRPAPEGATQDQAFRPDRVPDDGELLQLGGLSLRVVHTPGHASNHLCFLLENTGMLFTGDHVMQGSTVVIDPPDGDMLEYLVSLERLREVDAAIIAPGHGYLVGGVREAISRLIAHRLWRERKVLDALHGETRATPRALVPRVYDDVPASRHAAAERSLLAHLLKLERERRVVREGEQYRLG